jgi:hypothetical protein
MSQENGILIWRDPADWNEAIHRLLEDCLPQAIKVAIERDPEEYFYYYAEWSEKGNIQCRNGKELPGYRELMEGIERIYPKIRMFHACRTADINSYLTDGLLTMDLSEQIQKAKQIFMSDRFPHITEEHINSAAKEIASQGRENKICLSLDDINLREHTPEYFRYGSESLRIIALHLPKIGNENYMEFLRTIGTPTIFVCDVPSHQIEKQRFFHMVTELIRWTVSYPYKPGEEAPSIDFTFTFNSDIDPGFITSYYHPI